MAGKLTVAPESDSRPAVVLNAAPMFSAIDQGSVNGDMTAEAKYAVKDGVVVIESVKLTEPLPSWLS
jgi:hypothetical protein